MRKQDYHVFVAGDKHRSLEIRKLQNRNEVGIEVTERGISSSSGMGDAVDFESSAEYFLTKDKAKELICALQEYFKI